MNQKAPESFFKSKEKTTAMDVYILGKLFFIMTIDVNESSISPVTSVTKKVNSDPDNIFGIVND